MKYYTLTEVCTAIAEVLSFELEPAYWIRAEVSSLSERGHCYLELVEKGEQGMLSAKVRATCWQSTWRNLHAAFLQQTGQALSVGMQVLVLAEVTMHPVYGLSLNIRDIDASFTLGDLARQRQQTLLRLEKEGMIGRQAALRLPTLVGRIAVISSDTAAGYQDFVDQLCGAGYAFSTALYPATMQGDRAAESIIAALDALAQQAEDFDAVVIIRGGGATTDLGCFDDYRLCCAVALFPLPILSGVGHTRDVSIVDMVCYQALKTPTAVAAFLIERMAAQQQRIEGLRQRLFATAQRQVLIRRHRLELLAERIRLCSPERIYRQGYSLLKQNGHVVRRVADVASGMQLTTYVEDGEIHSIAQ